MMWLAAQTSMTRYRGVPIPDGIPEWWLISKSCLQCRSCPAVRVPIPPQMAIALGVRTGCENVTFSLLCRTPPAPLKAVHGQPL